MKNGYFPLFVPLDGKTALLFGGGAVAARRLRGLIQFGVRVSVTAPRFCEQVRALAERYPDQVTLTEGVYEPGTIADADVVLSATDDPEADEMIFEECRSKGILVNIASDQHKCDFYFPALIEQDGIVIGVCSGGTDHRKVRRVSEAIRRALAETEREEEANEADPKWNAGE